MVKTLLKLSILFFILLSVNSYALNMGSVSKSKYAEISVGETAKFKMLFWNIENETYNVKLSVKEAPKDWIVIIDPKEFNLNKSIGEEYIKLPYMKENVKAKIVNLFVKPYTKSKSGKYFVTIMAEISSKEKNGIKIIPATMFKFEIVLKSFNGFKMNENVENNNTINFSRNDFKSKNENLKIINSENGGKKDKKVFYLTMIFLIILISIILYKKS